MRSPGTWFWPKSTRTRAPLSSFHWHVGPRGQWSCARSPRGCRTCCHKGPASQSLPLFLGAADSRFSVVDPLRQEYLLHRNRHGDFSAVRFTGVLRSLRISPTLSYSSHGQHFRLSRLGDWRVNHLGQRLPQTVLELRAARRAMCATS